MVAAAVIGGAVVSGVGSAVASSNNKKAINKSTAAQTQAQDKALAAQQQAFNQILPLQQSALANAQANNLNALTASTGLQTGAYNSAGQALTSAYNNSTSALAPYMKTGYAANDLLNEVVGLPKTGGYTPQTATFKPAVTPALPASGMASATPAITNPSIPTPATPAIAAPTTLAALVQSPEYKAMTAGQKMDARRALTMMPKR